jgi:hypothetical protein
MEAFEEPGCDIADLGRIRRRIDVAVVEAEIGRNPGLL